MLVMRAPGPRLRPFLRRLWACEETAVRAEREHVIPTGAMHVVFRLCDHPLRVFADHTDRGGRVVGLAVVGGARSGFYVRDVSRPLCSVGLELHPGAAEALLGAPADELAETHTALADLWGRAATDARERLLEARGLAQRLDVLEALLAARAPIVRGLHPAVANALRRLGADTPVGDVVADSGRSHRAFIALFRRAVGLGPKRYGRVVRFQRALDRAAAGDSGSWVDVALAAGYSDQPHFNREFRELAGVSPCGYRRAAPTWSRHVPVQPR